MAEGVVLRRLRAQLDDALMEVRSAERNLAGWGNNSDDDLGDRRDYKDDLADTRRKVDRLRAEIEKERTNPTPDFPRPEKFRAPQPPLFPASLLDVEIDFLAECTLEEVDTALAFAKQVSAVKHLAREVEMLQALVDVIADKLGGKALPVLWGIQAEGMTRWRGGGPRYPADLKRRGDGWWIIIQCDGWQLCFGSDAFTGSKPHEWYFCEEGKDPVSLHTPCPPFETPPTGDQLQRIYDIQTKYLSRGVLWRMCVFAYDLGVDTREPFPEGDARAWANEWFEKKKRDTAPAAFDSYAPVINKTVTTTTLTVDREFWKIQKEKKDKCPSPTKRLRRD